MPVAVMSGGDFPQFEKQFVSQLPKEANLSNLYIFPTSAGECLSYKDGAWVQEYDYAFQKDEKQKIIKAILDTIESTGISKNEAHFGPQIEDRGEQITFSALGQQAPLEIKSVWDPDQKKRRLLQEDLERALPEFSIRIGGTTSIDITKKQISKITGIEWLERRFGIHAKDMLYVGDALYAGGNDSVVKNTDIVTKQVAGPEETEKIIEELLKK
jgi:HAD superfamily hydrolase (TIGR01484 family)